MSRKFLYVSVSAFAILTLLISSIYAESDSARDEIITRKLDALSRCAESHQGVDWVDICFTSEAEMNVTADEESAPAESDDAIVTEPENEATEEDASDGDEGTEDGDYKKDDTTNKESKPSEFFDIGYRQIASADNSLTHDGNDISYKEVASTDDTDIERYQLHEDYYTDISQNSFLWAFSRQNDLTKFEMGPEVYYYDYREPGLMKDRGMMYGIYGAYTYRISENLHIKTIKDIFSDTNKINVFKTDVRFAFGDVDYESNGTGTIDGIEYFTFEGRGLLGYDIPVQSRSRVTPYLGLGWRYLKDDSGGMFSSTGHWAYDRESEYFYVPFGIESNTRMKNDWDLTLTVEYDFFVSGNQTSHLEDGGISVCSSTDLQCYALDPLENDQNDGFGLRGSMKLVKKTEKIDFSIEPFVRYWKIDESEVKQLSSLGGEIVWFSDAEFTRPIMGVEPDNETMEYGLKVGLQY